MLNRIKKYLSRVHFHIESVDPKDSGPWIHVENTEEGRTFSLELSSIWVIVWVLGILVALVFSFGR